MTEKDKNDVIDWLNDVVYSPERAYNDYYSESEQQLLAKNALELIKKQETIVVEKRYDDALAHYGSPCPKCSRWIISFNSFCGNCGQAVKWNG